MTKEQIIELLESLKWQLIEDGLIPTLDEAIERVKQTDCDESAEEHESTPSAGDEEEDEEPQDEPYDHYQEEYGVTNRE